jgi:hypothetical protein
VQYQSCCALKTRTNKSKIQGFFSFDFAQGQNDDVETWALQFCSDVVSLKFATLLHQFGRVANSKKCRSFDSAALRSG